MWLYPAFSSTMEASGPTAESGASQGQGQLGRGGAVSTEFRGVHLEINSDVLCGVSTNHFSIVHVGVHLNSEFSFYESFFYYNY